MNFKLCISILLATSGIFIGSYAQAEVAPVTDDLFDVNQGVAIISNLNARPFSDNRDMFGGQFSSREKGDTVFSDYPNAGTVHTVEWRTASPIALHSINLFTNPAKLSRDPAGIARAYSHFTLYAQASDGRYVKVADFTPADPLVQTVESITVEAPVSARFKAEFTQYQNSYGPRIVELDGFGEVLPTLERFQPSSEDLWDISSGTTVANASSLYLDYDETKQNMFGGNIIGANDEDKNTVFKASEPNSIHSIEWKTANPIKLEQVRIFAYHDQFKLFGETEFRDARYHGFKKVTLLYKNEAGEYVSFYEYYPNNPYDLAQKNDPLLILADIEPFMAQEFRAEFTQMEEMPPKFPELAGPRIVELDGFGEVVQQENKPEPVLIIPGILGSQLSVGGNLVWVDLDKIIKDAGDKFLTENLSLDANGNSIKIVETGSAIPFLGLADFSLFRWDIFNKLVESLESSGYVDNYTYRLFSYDWRLDLDESVSKLHDSIQDLQQKNNSDKVAVVAHSMGGLLLKNYIQQYGKEDIDKIIFIGTPHLGAPKSGKVLLEGDRFGIPFLNSERMKELSVNSPAVYELLPSPAYFSQFIGYIKPYSLFAHAPLNFSETKDFLLSKSLNSNIFSKAEKFFSRDLQNTPFSGIDTYNIAGCGLATQSGYSYGFANSFIANVKYSSGDGTVPVVSADYVSVPADHKYYALKANHDSLPSLPGVRNLIVDILKDEQADSYEDVSKSFNDCNFKGKELVWKSPVEIHVYDSEGNHTGPSENNSIEYNIEGVDYDIIGHEKFVLLPTDNGQTYTVIAKGLDIGTFDLVASDNNNGAIEFSTVFNDVPVTPSTTVTVGINSEKLSEITVKKDLETDAEAITATSMIEGSFGSDITQPVTTLNVEGDMGEAGWYKTDAQVTLGVIDAESGILATYYAIDEEVFTEYHEPITLASEGMHSIRYYSIDKAGNNEEIQTKSITIDKTAPEFTVSYNNKLNKFDFTTFDDLDIQTSPDCLARRCTVKDKAGNRSILKFRVKKTNGANHSVTVNSIKYNDKLMTFPTTTLEILDRLEKKKRIDFNQILVIKKQEHGRINYRPKKDDSIIVSKLKGEKKTTYTLPGIHVLQVKTNKGDLGWEVN